MARVSRPRNGAVQPRSIPFRVRESTRKSSTTTITGVDGTETTVESVYTNETITTTTPASTSARVLSDQDDESEYKDASTITPVQTFGPVSIPIRATRAHSKAVENVSDLILICSPRSDQTRLSERASSRPKSRPNSSQEELPKAKVEPEANFQASSSA